jgi:hypothetical protein
LGEYLANATADLVDTRLKATAASGSAGYHFDLLNNWLMEPTGGTARASHRVGFDSMFGLLVDGGGTAFMVADTLALPAVRHA